ncbi:unnamed protein product [Orchesella dallaii]|uniref:Ionotropic glutamate receptor C-terminal domain-containing protein n=1 Tax=Orchesella dallaii TaxID=48710 RepID=A0ABP1RAD6_9HEXA
MKNPSETDEFSSLFHNSQGNFKQSVYLFGFEGMVNVSEKHIITNCLFCTNPTFQVNSQADSIPTLNTLFPYFTRNFNGHQLHVGAPSSYKPAFEMKLVNGICSNNGGIQANVFCIVQSKLNFTFNVNSCTPQGNSTEGKSGSILPNGIWTGCVGDVLYGRRDIALSVSPSKDRMKVLQFTVPMQFTILKFTTHKPQAYHDWVTIFLAFDPFGWESIFVAVLLMALTIYVIEKLQLQKLVLTQKTASLQSNILYLYGYLVGQGICLELEQRLAIFLLGIWTLCGFFVCICYLCALQSIIISPKFTKIPETIPELVHSTFKWGCSQRFLNGLGAEVFKLSENPVFQQIHKKMGEDKDDVECLTKAARTDYACFQFDIITWFHIGRHFTDRAGEQPFLFGKDSPYFTLSTFVLRKEEIFMEEFNDVISSFVYMGLEKPIVNKDVWKVRKKRLEKAKENFTTVDNNFDNFILGQDEPMPISLENVKATFLVLIIGMFTALACFFGEVARYYFKLHCVCIRASTTVENWNFYA